MPILPTLQHALDARSLSTRGINYVNGEQDERRMAFADLANRALGVLRHLQSAGALPGAEAIILVDGIAPFVDAFWACILGRVVAVPLAPGNADEHKAKVFRVLTQLRAPCLATERKVFERLRTFALEHGLTAQLEKLRHRTVFLDEIDSIATAGTRHAADPDDIAFIQYSSGSTSEPKGVILTHRNLTTNIDAIGAGIDASDGDASLSWMPLTHDMGLIGFHLTPLVADIEHWLMPTALFVRRPGLWLAKCSEHRISITCSPNFGYLHYLKTHDATKSAKLDLSSVRLVFNGAEPIAAELCRSFTAALAPAGLRSAAMFPVYGLAEASLAVTFPRVGAPLATIVLARSSLGPGQRVEPIEATGHDGVELVKLGTPVRGCELRVADAGGEPAAAGTVGRILIRGASVSAGYYDRAHKVDPLRDANRFIDTGDLGTMFEGQLVVTGRVKDVMFVAGQNHYPQDVELVLAEHAGLEPGRAAVTGTRRTHAAADDVLVFVLAKGDDLGAFAEMARTVRRVVNERMGIPVAHVVPIRQFPKTTSGKVQRFALAKDFEAGLFVESLAALAKLDGAADAFPALPGGEIEATLLAICQAALPQHKLSPDDNLFELGTGSLTLAQIYERIEALYPGYLEVTDFFEYPTVRAMAGFLAQRKAEG